MTTDQAAAESTNLRHMIEGLRRAADRTPGLRYSSFRDYRRSLASALRLLRLPGLRQALALAGAVRQWAAVRGPRFLRRAYTRLRLRRR